MNMNILDRTFWCAGLHQVVLEKDAVKWVSICHITKVSDVIIMLLRTKKQQTASKNLPVKHRHQ